MRYGTAPSELDPLARSNFPSVWRPWYLRPGDGLHRFFDEQPNIIARGVVRLGSFVQVNSRLFSFGLLDLPGELLVCLDDQIGPDEILEMAEDVYSLRFQDRPDAEGRRVSEYLADELTRVVGLPVPADISGGKAVFCTTTMFRRSSFPKRKIMGKLFPILVDPHTCFAMALPHQYWSEEARDLYQSMSE